ncbi:MAG: hypothetical protein ACRD3J_04065 [Thermoanaerobaculia bacterium]
MAVIEELIRRMEEIESEALELEDALTWFEEQMMRPNMDRFALRAVLDNLRNRSAQLKAKIATFQKDLH